MDITEYIATRDGKEEKVLSTKLVLDDVIKIENGQQIPADAVVLSGEAYVNESLLTGEVDEIKKVKNSELKSGSFIVAGSVIAKLTNVGKDSYINKLSEQAKEIKEKKTEMINAIEKIEISPPNNNINVNNSFFKTPSKPFVENMPIDKI